jgi:hypothetical protein
MSKPCLTLAEIDEQSVVELPERQLLAVAVGVGGLAGVAVAIDNVNVPIDVNVEDNQICVNVAAVVAAAGCD